MPSKKDYVPDSAKNQRDWAQNIIDTIAAVLTGVEGWDAARIAAFVVRVTTIRDAAQAVINAQAAVDSATGALDQLLGVQLPEVRQDIGNMKKSRGWDDGKGDALDVNTPAANTNPATLKATIKAEGKKQGVEIMVRKYGADSANIYARKRGDTVFALLAAKRKRFPFIDDAPPANPEQPEEREYQVILVQGDIEIGLPSDIATAVWRP